MGFRNLSRLLLAVVAAVSWSPTFASQICSATASGLVTPSKHEQTVLAAKSAGLDYDFPAENSGYRRLNLSPKDSKKPQFIYANSQGVQVTDASTIQRLSALGIPPAHNNVWIAENPNAHIQGLSQDAKGKTQYFYHPRWIEVTAHLKFKRAVQFGKSLPLLMNQIERDLQDDGFPKSKIVAAVTQLLHSTLIRVGNIEGVQNNESFGLTTMQKTHVTSTHPVTLYFKGKSNKWHTKVLPEGDAARTVRSLLSLPGQNLFQHVDSQGAAHPISSDDVNTYIKASLGPEFSAKDFRTWMASYYAADFLSRAPPPVEPGQSTPSEKRLRALFLEASEYAASYLGNTASVCRTSYIHPAIFEAYRDLDTFRKAFQTPGPTSDPTHNGLIRLLENGSTQGSSSLRGAP